MALGRADGDAEGLGDGGEVQILVVAEHDHGPLPAPELLERAPDQVLLGQVGTGRGRASGTVAVGGPSGARTRPPCAPIAVVTYGTIPDAEALIAQVRGVHERVRGKDERGAPTGPPTPTC